MSRRKFARKEKYAMRWKSNNQNKQREAISRIELEKAIANFVRSSNPACQKFVTVIVSRTTPTSRNDSNWAVQGIKYGKADRVLCNAALSGVVAKKQLQFQLSEAKP